MNEKGKLMSDEGISIDGRKWDELRPIKFEVGTLEKADGSAYIEWGKNKILVAVYGPREVKPRHMALPAWRPPAEIRSRRVPHADRLQIHAPYRQDDG